jgi:hypothetical protein
MQNHGTLFLAVVSLFGKEYNATTALAVALGVVAVAPITIILLSVSTSNWIKVSK